jgi:hypothetical protein
MFQEDVMKESDFENIIVKYPELIEDELQLIGQQVTAFGRRMDLLFKDKFQRKLIVELKKGVIKDAHVGQILSYEGMLLSHDDPTIRVMLVGNRVPPNIGKSLDHHGIAWKEITYANLKQFLTIKNDTQFLKLFDQDACSLKKKKRIRLDKPSPKTVSKADSYESIFHPILSNSRILAVDIIKEFNNYVKSNPDNKHNKFPSHKKKDKLIEPLAGMAWDDVVMKQKEITEWLRLYGGTYKGYVLSERSIELAWIGLAYCYEYCVVKGIIPNNPFNDLLPNYTRTGSYID